MGHSERRFPSMEQLIELLTKEEMTSYVNEKKKEFLDGIPPAISGQYRDALEAGFIAGSVAGLSICEKLLKESVKHGPTSR